MKKSNLISEVSKPFESFFHWGLPLTGSYWSKVSAPQHGLGAVLAGLPKKALDRSSPLYCLCWYLLASSFFFFFFAVVRVPEFSIQAGQVMPLISLLIASFFSRLIAKQLVYNVSIYIYFFALTVNLPICGSIACSCSRWAHYRSWWVKLLSPRISIS